MAPNFSVLWAEWANLDAERGRIPAAFSKLERSAALGITDETGQVADAVIRGMGIGIDDAVSLRQVSAELRRRGFPALAAYYASRASKR